MFGSAFSDMFGGGRRPQGPRRGQDLRYDLEITLEQAYAGSNARITVPASLNCEICSGSGCKPGTHPTTCTTCNGQGRVRATQGFFAIERTCPRCGGSGRMVLDPCTGCHGAGQMRKERTLEVAIPPGVDDGARIRLEGEGDAGSAGAPRGDLYIFLSVRPHELFERDGLDLLCTVPVPMCTAALGGGAHRHRNGAQQVQAIALEQLVRAYAQEYVEVSARGSGRTGVALALQADAGAVVDAGRNGDLEGPFLAHLTGAMAAAAGIQHHPS